MIITEKKKKYFECKFDYRAKIKSEQVDLYCIEKNIKQDKNSFNILDYLNFENKVKKELIQKLRFNIKELIPNSIIEQSNYSIKILIPINKFSDFFKHFKSNKLIDWSYVSTLNHLPWSEELIESGKDIWNWELLQSYKVINWTFEYLEKYKDLINWSFVPDLKLKWDIKKIHLFIDYLNFRIAPSRSSINYQEYLHKNNKVFECFSDKEDLDWDDLLIIEFYEKWDWFYLSRNNGIDWTIERIEKFNKSINFSSLSDNQNIKWNYNFIKKYSNELDFSSLVRNNSVYWTIEMFTEFFNKINIYYFAKSALISPSVIINNKNIWKEEFQKTEYNRKAYESYTLHTLWESLSENKNLIWNDELFDNCIDEIYFNKISDKQIHIKVSTINKYWDYKKTERIYSRFSDNAIFDKYEEFYFRDIIKNAKIIDLTLKNIELYKVKWFGVLISDDFTNDSIKKLINNKSKYHI